MLPSYWITETRVFLIITWRWLIAWPHDLVIGVNTIFMRSERPLWVLFSGPLSRKVNNKSLYPSSGLENRWIIPINYIYGNWPFAHTLYPESRDAERSPSSITEGNNLLFRIIRSGPGPREIIVHPNLSLIFPLNLFPISFYWSNFVRVAINSTRGKGFFSMVNVHVGIFHYCILAICFTRK